MEVSIPFDDGTMKGERWILWALEYVSLHGETVDQMSFADIPDAIFFEDLSPDENEAQLGSFALVLLMSSLGVKFECNEFSFAEDGMVTYMEIFKVLLSMESLRRCGLIKNLSIDGKSRILGVLMQFIHEVFQKDSSLPASLIKKFDNIHKYSLEIVEPPEKSIPFV